MPILESPWPSYDDRLYSAVVALRWWSEELQTATSSVAAKHCQ